MPSYIRLATPTAYYYMTPPSKNTQLNPKIGIDRNNINNIDYTYGLIMSQHTKDSGFNLLSDLTVPFKKGDTLKVSAFNLTKGAGAYSSSFSLILAYDGPARWLFTTAEMQKLGAGKTETFADLYSPSNDTIYVIGSYFTEIVLP